MLRWSPAIFVLASGCYAHALSPGPEVATARIRPALIPPMVGDYLITKDGAPIGEEHFAITSSASVWRVEGTVHLTSPAESTHGYVLEIDEARAEPITIVAWVELSGARRSIEAHRTEDGYFEFAAEGIGGASKRRIPYAPGTSIAFDSPIFHTLVSSLLRATLKMSQPIAVRTIVMPMPSLRPSVLLSTYELVGAEDGVQRVVVRMARTERVEALWLGASGLPIRMRRFESPKTSPAEWRLNSDPASAPSLPRETL